MTVIEHVKRQPRVRFKHPVRVVPLDGAPRVFRTLSADLSTQGMFVRFREPLPLGSRVALSLEAGGQALPFAQAEVMWCRGETDDQQGADQLGHYVGCGVRFTEFLHPRAPELVEYLVKNLDRGRPLQPAPAPRPRWMRVAAGAVAALAATLAIAAAGWTLLRAEPVEPAEDRSIAAQPVVVGDLIPTPIVVAPPPAPEPEPEPAPAPIQELAEAPATLPPPETEQAVVEVVAPTPTPVAIAPRAETKRPEQTGVVKLPSGGAKELAWEFGGNTLRVSAAPAAKASLLKSFALAKPSRLVFDLAGRAPAKSHVVTTKAPFVKDVRVGRLGKGTRVVVDLSKTPMKVAEEAGALVLTF